MVERFRREATATASLSSPHTVTLYDFGVSEQGQFYYVMEMLDGFDLEHYLGKHGTMPPARLVHFLIHACRSLVEAHAAGLVHRDLKPSNMYACRLGLEVDVLKILDFGLVRQAGGNQPRLTQADLIVGTPDFIAPECAMGKSDLDGRTDIYSLAATAYNLAAGKSVFTGANPMVVVMQHIQAKPVPLATVAPGVPQGLSDLIMACLAKSPADRPDAQVLLAALMASGIAQGWSETDRQAWWAEHRPARKA
jgi:serine/threonine-protein kinase